MHKEAIQRNPNNFLIDLKTHFGIQSKICSVAEQSNIVYLSIVDLQADTIGTMEAVISKLHTEYGIGVRSEHLILVGDAKTYARLQELKHRYGQDLDWLLPFIGDWHHLKNY